MEYRDAVRLRRALSHKFDRDQRIRSAQKQKSDGLASLFGVRGNWPLIQLFKDQAAELWHASLKSCSHRKHKPAVVGFTINVFKRTVSIDVADAYSQRAK